MPTLLTPTGSGTRPACEFGMTGVDEMVAAAARQPGGTLMLRSDRLTPAELADQVLDALRHHRVGPVVSSLKT
jgi:hypothetical protein